MHGTTQRARSATPRAVRHASVAGSCACATTTLTAPEIQPHHFRSWGVGYSTLHQGTMQRHASLQRRPRTAAGSNPSSELVLSRLDKRKQLHALETRVLEHDLNIKRYEQRLRQQRAASLQQLKWAGQTLLDLHKDDALMLPPPGKPSAELIRLRKDYEQLQRDFRQVKSRMPRATVDTADEAAVAPHCLALEVRRLEQENAELRAALAARESPGAPGPGAAPPDGSDARCCRFAQ